MSRPYHGCSLELCLAFVNGVPRNLKNQRKVINFAVRGAPVARAFLTVGGRVGQSKCLARGRLGVPFSRV